MKLLVKELREYHHLIECDIEDVLTCSSRAKRYERLLKANGIHPSGGLIEAASSPKLTPSTKRKKKAKDERQQPTISQSKKRKLDQDLSLTACSSKSMSPPTHESRPDIGTGSKRIDTTAIPCSPEPPREVVADSPPHSLIALAADIDPHLEKTTDQAQSVALQDLVQHDQVRVRGLPPRRQNSNSQVCSQFQEPYSTITQSFPNSPPFATMSGLPASVHHQSSLFHPPQYLPGSQDPMRHMFSSGGVLHPRHLIYPQFPEYPMPLQPQGASGTTPIEEVDRNLNGLHGWLKSTPP